ncbi:DNA polymerase III subunit delta [Methylomonas sp. EFPC3]|uniref:DNA polymerase III subunit delta n=1 Tax=Methylomonas sp. EFPC3 TaxID=3021710 RepID=UPI0024179ADA|nr:DNA polymerase III subunit delta [Methylomonas sp. EFPC3]WFP50325.1 DNA polymerase III subunit delta [Methylomonas sp. EFPC3]
MRLKVEQLAAALQKSVAPVYLVSGDEPLQLGEAADDIRQAARAAGYTTREVISVESGHEWPQLSLEADSLSIFSDKKLIDLRLPSAKPGTEGSKALIAYCQHLPDDTVLLVTAGKLESAAQKSQWFQALDVVGVIVQVWPLQGQEWLHWLQRRAERRGMRLENEALKSLAVRVEGNLLAAAQEIEKLYILHGAALVSKAMIEDDVADSARFDVFKLTDALLEGKLNRSLKILNGLRAEGTAASIVLWAICRETRMLLLVKAEFRRGVNPEAVFKKFQIWDKRKSLVQEASRRLRAEQLQGILRAGAEVDRCIKGQAVGNEWEGLFGLCLRFAGMPDF